MAKTSSIQPETSSRSMSDSEISGALISSNSSPAKLAGLFLYRCSTFVAYFGGLTLVILVAINAVSIAGRTLFSSPLVGDFELVELGCAIAISSFLPLCLLRKGNVTVDFFSARFSDWILRYLAILSDFFFVIVAGTFSVRMSSGIYDFYKYGEETMLLQIPIWIPFIPVLLSFYLLTVCAIYKLSNSVFSSVAD